MRLWLDDIRPMPDGYDVWCRTSDEAITQLLTRSVTHISFDHDLGGDDTGYLVAMWIEEQVYTAEYFTMPTWSIHSANPVGARRIRAAMESADRCASTTTQ